MMVSTRSQTTADFRRKVITLEGLQQRPSTPPAPKTMNEVQKKAITKRRPKKKNGSHKTKTGTGPAPAGRTCPMTKKQRQLRKDYLLSVSTKPQSQLPAVMLPAAGRRNLPGIGRIPSIKIEKPSETTPAATRMGRPPLIKIEKTSEPSPQSAPAVDNPQPQSFHGTQKDALHSSLDLGPTFVSGNGGIIKLESTMHKSASGIIKPKRNSVAADGGKNKNITVSGTHKANGQLKVAEEAVAPPREMLQPPEDPELLYITPSMILVKQEPLDDIVDHNRNSIGCASSATTSLESQSSLASIPANCAISTHEFSEDGPFQEFADTVFPKPIDVACLVNTRNDKAGPEIMVLFERIQAQQGTLPSDAHQSKFSLNKLYRNRFVTYFECPTCCQQFLDKLAAETHFKVCKNVKSL